MELRTQNDFDIHVERVRKKGINLIEDYSLSSFGIFKIEIIDEIEKKTKTNNLEDMVYRFQLTYGEIIDTLDLKHVPTCTTGSTLPPGVYKNIDIVFMFKSLLPKEVKVDITIDDIRLKSNLTTDKTIMFTKKSFFYKNLSFTQSHSKELANIDGLIQLIPSNYKSDRPIKNTGIDKVHLRCYCADGAVVNGTRQPILYTFALSSRSG